MAPASKSGQYVASGLAGPSLTSMHSKRAGEEDEMLDRQSDISDEENVGGSAQNKEGGSGAVSKRTLQNRKAQREFRKRREARVRELEERCRRYDQMGLEANSELQRVARSLKDENYALRCFIVRLGYGHALPDILQGIGNGGNHSQLQHNPGMAANDNSFVSAQSFSDSNHPNGNTGGQFNGPTFYVEPSSDANGNNGRHSMQFDADISSSMDKMRNSIASTTLAPTPTGSMLLGSNASIKASSPSHAARTNGHIKANSSSGNQISEQNDAEAPLLSLSLNNQTNRQQQQSDSQRSASEYAQRITAQSLNALFPGGAGLGGTAMLANIGNSNNNGNTFTPFPVPKRSQQNSALLNPNPIPFSFNLSNGGDQNNKQPTWWEQMGGSADGVELDEKAQAVANAQIANSQQPQSPFDLSSFLQGGLTPGGGFQLGNIGGSQTSQVADAAASKGTPASEADRGRNTADTDHMRFFIQLMERKMAERDARTYASLGFQPPSQDPAQRSKQEDADTDKGPTITLANSWTPSRVYSRLSQHPAFLSTNAQEMEELVDALDSSPSTSWSAKNNSGRDVDKLADDSKVRNHDDRKDFTVTQDDEQNQSDQSSGASVHVDEGDFGKLFGLLDKKSSASLLVGRNNNGAGFDQRLSMAMT